VMERSRTGMGTLVQPLVAPRSLRARASSSGMLGGKEDLSDGGFATRVLLQQHFRLRFGGVEHRDRGSPLISQAGGTPLLLATEAKHPPGSPAGVTVTFRPHHLGGNTEPGSSRLSFTGGYEGKLIRSRN